VVGTLCNNGKASGSATQQDAESGMLIPVCQFGDVAGTLTARYDSSPCDDRGMNVVAFAQNTRDEVRLMGGDGQIAGALAAEPGMKQQTYLAFQPQATASQGIQISEICPTLDKSKVPGVIGNWKVRRLMPVECARLQGFKDRYLSAVKYKGKAPKDAPMYKAFGNSMAIPPMSWIGQRIQLVNDLQF